MSRRRIETVINTKADRMAKVYRDSEWAEYVVEFYEGQTRIELADYHTDDRADAQLTARSWVKRGCA